MFARLLITVLALQFAVTAAGNSNQDATFGETVDVPDSAILSLPGITLFTW